MKETLIDWLGTFWKVLVSPTPKTFLAEAKKADGKFASAMGWLVFFALYLYVIASVTIISAPLSLPTLLAAVLVIPLSVILFASAMHFIYRRVFDGKAYLYDKMLYITVSVLFPIFFVFTFLALFVPANIFVFVTYIIFFYQVTLLTIGMKALAKIEYWQALVCVAFSMIAGIVAGGIAVITIYATLIPPEFISPESMNSK